MQLRPQLEARAGAEIQMKVCRLGARRAARDQAVDAGEIELLLPKLFQDLLLHFRKAVRCLRHGLAEAGLLKRDNPAIAHDDQVARGAVGFGLRKAHARQERNKKQEGGNCSSFLSRNGETARAVNDEACANQITAGIVHDKAPGGGVFDGDSRVIGLPRLATSAAWSPPRREVCSSAFGRLPAMANEAPKGATSNTSFFERIFEALASLAPKG